MKNWIILCLLPFSLTIQAQQKAYSLENFTWLEGNWERQGMKEGTSAVEFWALGENHLTGKGISLRGTDTTFVEGLSIQIKEGTTYYIADVPGNDAPTFFEVKSISETGFISENLKHDFPKRIQYILSDNLLTVVISDGGNKKITFTFTKR